MHKKGREKKKLLSIENQFKFFFIEMNNFLSKQEERTSFSPLSKFNLSFYYFV